MKKLTQGKWYTNLLIQIVEVERYRRELDIKDSYTFRHISSDLDNEIKALLPILRDVDAVIPTDRKDVYEIIKELFNQGQWEKEFRELRNDITKCYEHNFTCEFCGVYRAFEARCNECNQKF